MTPSYNPWGKLTMCFGAPRSAVWKERLHVITFAIHMDFAMHDEAEREETMLKEVAKLKAEAFRFCEGDCWFEAQVIKHIVQMTQNVHVFMLFENSTDAITYKLQKPQVRTIDLR